MDNFLKIAKDFLTKTFFGVVPGWAFVAVGAILLIAVITLICVSASKKKKNKKANAKNANATPEVTKSNVVDIIPTRERIKLEKEAELAKAQPPKKSKKTKDENKEIKTEKELSEMEKYFSEESVPVGKKAKATVDTDAENITAEAVAKTEEIAKTMVDAIENEVIEDITSMQETIFNIDGAQPISDDAVIPQDIEAVVSEEEVPSPKTLPTDEIALTSKEAVSETVAPKDMIDDLFESVEKERKIEKAKKAESDALLAQIEEKRKKDIAKKIERTETNVNAPIKSVPKNKQPLAVTVGAMSKLKPKTEAEKVVVTEIVEVEFVNNESDFSILFKSENSTVFVQDGLKSAPTDENVDSFKKLIKNGNFVIEKNKTGGFILKLLDENYLSANSGMLFKSRKECEQAIASLTAFCKNKNYTIKH